MKHFTLTQEQIEQLDYSKPISFYAKEFGLSDTTLRRKFKELGIYSKFYFCSGENTGRLKSAQIREEYFKNPKKCLECGEPLSYEQKTYRFCGSSCSQKFRYRADPNLGKRQGEETKRRIEEGSWKKPSPPRTPKCVKIEKKCEHCGETMLLYPYQERDGRRFCSKRCSRPYEGGLGGYREGSGTGKSGWYKGFFCNSSWELAWVIYSIDRGVCFCRNLDGFEYNFSEETHKYFPDFILEDGTYVEIKGYDSEQWQAKKKQFPRPLQELGKQEMQPIIKYVREKYGNNFIEMYEGNPHNEKTNQCVICGGPCKNKCCSKRCAGKYVKTFSGKRPDVNNFSPVIS